MAFNPCLKFIEELEKLELDTGRYVIFGSGPMAAHGLRGNHDLDVLVRKELWDGLTENGYKSDDGNCISVGNVNIYRDLLPWLKENDELYGKIMDDPEIIEGIPFTKLDYVLEVKKRMNRPKDREDIELINNFLNRYQD